MLILTFCVILDGMALMRGINKEYYSVDDRAVSYTHIQDFYFDLPEELIAKDPLEDRSSSRLLVLDKETGETSHHIFKEIVDYLNPGDCLVINDTKVIPSRLIGAREGTGAKIEVLLLKRKENNVWETLVKPGKKDVYKRQRSRRF